MRIRTGLSLFAFLALNTSFSFAAESIDPPIANDITAAGEAAGKAVVDAAISVAPPSADAIANTAATAGNSTASAAAETKDALGDLPSLGDVPALPGAENTVKTEKTAAEKKDEKKEDEKTTSIGAPPPVAIPLATAATKEPPVENKPTESANAKNEAPVKADEKAAAQPASSIPPVPVEAKAPPAQQSSQILPGVAPIELPNDPTMLPVPDNLMTPPPPPPGSEAAAAASAAAASTTPPASPAGQPGAEAKPEEKKVAVKKKRRAKQQIGVVKERYRNIHLPETISMKKYDRKNRHLPTARYEQDLDALLFIAIRRDDINGVRAMLDYSKRGINIPAPNGDTPLIAAVRNKSSNTVRLLLGRHADTSAVDARGMTASAVARNLGYNHIADMIDDRPGTPAKKVMARNSSGPMTVDELVK